MKVVKIKNLRNKQEKLEWLSLLLLSSEDKNSSILKVYPNEEFYVLTINDDVLPAYVHIKENEAIVLWVHKDYRSKGYASFMIQSLGIKYTIADPGSVAFWQKIGFQQLSSQKNGIMR